MVEIKIYELYWIDDYGVKQNYTYGTLENCRDELIGWYNENITEFDDMEIPKEFIDNPYLWIRGTKEKEIFYDWYVNEIIKLTLTL